MIFSCLLRKTRFAILLIIIAFMTVAKTYKYILVNLNHDMKILLKIWFRINPSQANPGKFQFMILEKKKETGSN